MPPIANIKLNLRGLMERYVYKAVSQKQSWRLFFISGQHGWSTANDFGPRQIIRRESHKREIKLANLKICPVLNECVRIYYQFKFSLFTPQHMTHTPGVLKGKMEKRILGLPLNNLGENSFSLYRVCQQPV